MTDHTRDRILHALNDLLEQNEQETQKRRSNLAFIAIGARRNALRDAIKIVEETQ